MYADFNLVSQDNINYTVDMVRLKTMITYEEFSKIDFRLKTVYNDILANKDMSSRQIPSKFKFRTSMPQTKNGKMDFVSLRKDDLTDDDIVNVVVAETNLSTSTIDIYQNESNDLVRKRK